MNYKPRKRTPSDHELLAAQRRAEVIRLFAEGMSPDEIARQAGFTKAWVGQIIMRHRTFVALTELLGPEEGKRVFFDPHFWGVTTLLKEHRWSPTREQVMEWVEEREAFYRQHALITADCAGTLEH